MKTTRKPCRYFETLKGLMAAIEVTDRKGRRLDLDSGVSRAVELIRELAGAGGQLFFIGNGASAAIASHQASDFWKAGGIPTRAFNDPAMLTSLGNDLGYEEIFARPLLDFARPGDLLVAISSSGRSVNIRRAVQAARRRGCLVLTLSGFKPANPLRGQGDLNFYVPAESYGPVEVCHHAICHCLLDTLVKGGRKTAGRG
ncbi:MAG TPA: SIS domain-containing protein [bacterium]|nr:SIS domain-containing protein [bacterium]